MARPDKAAAVEDIRSRFEDANAAILTEYRGLTVSEISQLRRSLRASETDYRVLKNTLARIVVRDLGLEELADQLVGPTAIAFIKGDAVQAAKALDDAAKSFPVLVIKGGVMGDKVMTPEQAKELARVEPREVQLAKIAMMMNSPLQQTVNVFAALLRDLGSMLAQVLAKKESGELPAGESSGGDAPADPAPAETPPAESSDVADAADPAGETAVEAAPVEASVEDADRGEGWAEAADVAADSTSVPAEEAVGSEEAQAAPPTTGTEAPEGEEG